MIPSCHYYVLSLGMEKSVLFEAFRDHLVDIRNQRFPVTRRPGSVEAGALPHLAREIDGCLAHHHAADPLGVVVVGDRALLSAFAAVTVHGPSIIGQVPGDHTATSQRDLGQIVWPVIKAAMSGRRNGPCGSGRLGGGRHGGAGPGGRGRQSAPGSPAAPCWSRRTSTCAAVSTAPGASPP